jgi:hypothetical protein
VQSDHGHAGQDFAVADLQAEYPVPGRLGGGAAVVEVEICFSWEEGRKKEIITSAGIPPWDSWSDLVFRNSPDLSTTFHVNLLGSVSSGFDAMSVTNWTLASLGW